MVQNSHGLKFLALPLFLLLCFPAHAEKISIFYGKQIPAQRVTVVKGGGYFPVMVRLHDGELVAALRGGGAHISVKGRLDWVRSKDNGKTWTVQELVDSPMDDRNPAVGQLKDGTILVTYIIDRSYGPNGERLKKLIRDGLYTVRSTDRGYTWSKPIKSYIDPRHGASPYGKMVQLSDGTVLLAVYYERRPGDHETSYVYRSKDEGRTWSDPTLIADNYNETSLLVLPGGRLLAVMRSHYGAHLATSFSDDKGRTWSQPRQITGDREHPGDAILLKDGSILLTYGERNRPYGVRAMVSRDMGKTWQKPFFILAADAQSPDCGYPSSVEVAPGRIVTIYYGVDGQLDPTGKKGFAPQGAYAKAILWSVPKE